MTQTNPEHLRQAKEQASSTLQPVADPKSLEDEIAVVLGWSIGDTPIINIGRLRQVSQTSNIYCFHEKKYFSVKSDSIGEKSHLLGITYTIKTKFFEYNPETFPEQLKTYAKYNDEKIAEIVKKVNPFIFSISSSQQLEDS